jgi:hypothetical protein
MTKFMTAVIVLLLIGSAPAQQNSMPDMPNPGKENESAQPPQANPQSMPGMQMPAAKPNPQIPQQAAPQPQPGMQHMEMRTPERIPSHVEDLQEPENPDRKTGADLPVPDLLAGAKATPPKTVEEFEQLAQQNNPTLK